MSTKMRKNKVHGRPPVKADPHKQKATLAQFATLAQEVQQAHQQLVAKTNRAIAELWRNQQEILKGLGSAEFNLRAHQKVMNALALELDVFIKSLPMPVGSGIEVGPSFLIRKEVEVDGETSHKIDWPAYHEMVEEELKAMREAEKAAKEAAAAQAAEPAQAAAAPKEASPIEESGTVPGKENGDPSIPEGATVFGS